MNFLVGLFIVLASAGSSDEGVSATETVSWNSTSPRIISESVRVECEGHSYEFSFRQSYGPEAFLLTDFTRSPIPLDDALFDRLRQELAKFQVINHFNYRCGIRRNGVTEEFLGIEIRGDYIGQENEERDACRDKGWSFHRLTRRSILLRENDIEVSGEKVGYCHGEATYFDMTIPLTKGENE